MMIKEKSNPWARMKYAYVLPLAAVAVTAFARPEFSNKMEEISAVKVNDLKEIVETKVLENQVLTSPAQEKPMVTPQDTAKNKKSNGAQTYEKVDEMPEYPGGIGQCLAYLAKNIKYPLKAIEKKVQGRVIVQFVVSKDGSILNPNVVRAVEPSLDAEAIRVIKAMPNWKPGVHKGQKVNVRFTMPVVFRLDGMVGSSEEAVKIRWSKDKPVPLIIIDGKEASKEILDTIDPKSVQSIDVLKEPQSTQSYGDKGKNGVISIRLKPQEASPKGKATQLNDVIVVGYPE